MKYKETVRYSIQSQSTGLEAELDYQVFVDDSFDLREVLVAVKISNAEYLTLSREDRMIPYHTICQGIGFLSTHCRTSEELERTAKANYWKLFKLSERVSFEDFWEAYNHKVDKKRAQDKWKKLKPADQLKAYRYIGKYLSELRTTGVAQLYPKTYIQNRVWEVE